MALQVDRLQDHVDCTLHWHALPNIIINFPEGSPGACGRVFRNVCLNIPWVDLSDIDTMLFDFRS
jgi:hypothetical protein